MKTIKKAKTFGEEGEWQVSKNDRKIVEKELRYYSDFSVQEEVIDDMIVILAKLGYVKIE